VRAAQGIEISEGKFSVQVSVIQPGGTAEGARQAGKMRVGDFLLSVDGWSCAQVPLRLPANSALQAAGRVRARLPARPGAARVPGCKAAWV